MNQFNFIVLLSFIFHSSINQKLAAQIDYKEHEAFFQEQIPIFSSWLEHNQLATYLKFNNLPIKVRKNEVTLYLEFRVTGVDASINALRQLAAIWLKETGFNLEESIFRKAVHIFEIPPKDLVVRIRSIPNEEGLGVDSRLQFKATAILMAKNYKVSSFSTLRSEVKDSLIIKDFELPEKISFSFQMDSTDRDYAISERVISNYLQNKLEEYFIRRGELEFSYPIASNSIYLGIRNLKHEVIEPGFIKSFDPHEKLDFTVKVLPQVEGALKVTVNIDGKYGPGLYVPLSGDYHSMNPKYLEQLNKYTLQFINKTIRDWIIAMPE